MRVNALKSSPAFLLLVSAVGCTTTNTARCDPSSPVEFARAPSGAFEVEPDWLAAHRCAVRVVDIRGQDELEQTGRIPDSTVAPFDELDLHAQEWSTHEPIVLVDRSGRRAVLAQRDLTAMGFEHVASLTGGMRAWSAGHFPTEGVAHVPHPAAEPSELGGSPISRLTQTEEMEWIGVSQLLAGGTQACIDGRDAHPVVGTPGGDAGELVLALAALESTTGTPIELSHLPVVFDAYVEAFGRFYIHTDTHSLERLGRIIEGDTHFRGHEFGDWSEVEDFVRHPPSELEDRLLDHLINPDAVGCGHLRLMLKHPHEYHTRRELIEAVLRLTFRRGWERPQSLRFVVLQGEHEERAIVRVMLDREVHAYTRVPMFAPHAHGSALFIVHPQVANYLRHELGSFLLEHTSELVDVPVDSSRYLRHLDELAATQLEETREALASDLPIYDLRVNDGRIQVTEVETPEVPTEPGMDAEESNSSRDPSGSAAETDSQPLLPTSGASSQ